MKCFSQYYNFFKNDYFLIKSFANTQLSLIVCFNMVFCIVKILKSPSKKLFGTKMPKYPIFLQNTSNPGFRFLPNMGPIVVSTFLNFYYDVINQLKSAEGKIMKISAQNVKKWLIYLISEPSQSCIVKAKSVLLSKTNFLG